MALINCPECGNSVSDKATSCPKCGFPLTPFVSSDETKESKSKDNVEQADVVADDNQDNNAGSVDAEQQENASLSEEQQAQSNDTNDIDDKATESADDSSADDKAEEKPNKLKEFFNKKVTIANKQIRLSVIIAVALAIVVIAVVLLIIFIPKGSSNEKSVTPAITSPVDYNSSSSESGSESVTETYDTNADIKMIGERTVEYHEENNEYIVFFALMDNNSEYHSACGTATVVFSDSTGNQLYNKNIPFTEADFTEWTNKVQDNRRYLCGLHISVSDISGAASSSGTASLSVVLDNGMSFDSYNMPVFDLKEKDIQINLPELPIKITQFDYNNRVEKIVEVTDIDVKTSVHSDGKASAKVLFTVKMLENYTNNTSSYTHIGYKLKNSDDVIVDSGTALISPMAVGETNKDDLYINDIDANDKYILILDNTK